MDNEYEAYNVISYNNDPENLMRLSQYDIPANSICTNKNPDLRLSNPENIQRLAPIRRKRLDERIDTYEKTSVCEGGARELQHKSALRESFLSNTGGDANALNESTSNIFKISNQLLYCIVFFIVLLFIVFHFNNSLNEIKILIQGLQKRS